MSVPEVEYDPADAAAAAARFAVGADPDVAYTVLSTPVGTLVAAGTRTGLVRLAYEDDNGGVDAILDRLAQRVSPRILEAPARLDVVRRELDEYFSGTRQAFDVPIDWTLTSRFGREVLRVCSEIPYGATATYAELAGRAGSPNGSRATGNALGANPIPIVIPCHRVLRTGGGLGGYTGGLHRKEALLAVEGR